MLLDDLYIENGPTRGAPVSLSIELALLVVGILLLAGVLAGKVADRLGVPVLLLFLAIGMIAGSEGLGGIHFDSAEIAQQIGTVALLVILFAGGLDTNWSAVRPVLGPGLVLSTLGVGLTTCLLAAGAWFLLGEFSTFEIGVGGLDWTAALLLAAIVSSTDAAAVFSVFRTSPVQPNTRVRSLLEFESGSNDPMAVLLTTGFLEMMTGGGGSIGQLVFSLGLAFLLGGLIGLAAGWSGAWVSDRAQFPVSGLYPVHVTTIALIAFGASELTGGNGYLAVYVAGVVFGNRGRAERENIVAFHDGLAWLAQIAMFVVLGLLVFPSRLLDAAPVSIALALFLMFVARPVAVSLCLLPFRPKRNELVYMSWVGLRGSVPIVLATFPASYGLPGADQIFSVVFFLVIASVLIQGFTLVPSARWLGVAESRD